MPLLYFYHSACFLYSQAFAVYFLTNDNSKVANFKLLIASLAVLHLMMLPVTVHHLETDVDGNMVLILQVRTLVVNVLLLVQCAMMNSGRPRRYRTGYLFAILFMCVEGCLNVYHLMNDNQDIIPFLSSLALFVVHMFALLSMFDSEFIFRFRHPDGTFVPEYRRSGAADFGFINIGQHPRPSEMKPVRISVTELFGEYDYDIPLSGDLTFVHSPNGMGKSTLMRMVCDMLSGDTGQLSQIPFRKLRVTMDDGSEIVATRDDGDGVAVGIARNLIPVSVSPGELGAVLKCTYIGPERLYIPAPDGHMESAFDRVLTELPAMIREAVGDSELAEVPGPDIPDGDLEREFKNIGARLDFIRHAGISPSVPTGYKFPPTRYDISRNPEGYNALARSLGEWCGRHYGFAENVVVFRDVVNTVYVNKTVSFNGNGDMEARMDRSGTMVPLEKFSSGEKHIAIMFYDLLFRTEPGSLAIVDEPEVSLHVSWQQSLGKLFMDIARLRGLTMIVATHAPAVIHSDWDRAVELRNIRE